MAHLQDVFLPFAQPKKVVFVGDYLPRQCGIATFTNDLYQSFAHHFTDIGSFVLSVNDVKEGYDYPPEVRFTFFQHELEEYKNAARFLNSQKAEIVCLQHEYGIYGGKAGIYILHFMQDLCMPIVTTLHTILEKPNEEQFYVMTQIVHLSSKVVVMSEKGKKFLIEIYKAPENKIEVIPHGIMDIPFVDAHFYKDIFGFSDQNVLLTFGLLSPNKGIETLIKALPEILKKIPNLIYMVVGATHPHLLREQKEAYRESLIQLAQDLGVEKNVKFYNQFVSKNQLMEFIGAADIYITPYLNPAQITSGTLAYSLGCGKAIVSTPYWYAEELLGQDCGVLTPFGDTQSMALTIIDLLEHDVKRNLLRKKAYVKGREMTWEKVIKSYEKTFTEARLANLNSTELNDFVSPIDIPLDEDGLPSLKLDQIFRLTDQTGILQHARYAFPNFDDGYCMDDNARALVLTLELHSIKPTHQINTLMDTYISFINHAFDEKTNGFHNFMSYEGTWLDNSCSEDCHGRALWALGSVICQNIHPQTQHWALDLFEKSLPRVANMTSPRAWAFSLIGIHKYLEYFKGDQFVVRFMIILEDKMLDIFQRTSSPTWLWFEEVLSYDNARLCQSMLLSKRKKCVDIGIITLDWLREIQTAENGYFQPIGSNGFYRINKERAFFDQQPLEAYAMASACVTAFHASKSLFWITEARRAFDWFIGKNIAGTSLYQASSGGCCDGLHVDRVNLNQGAESTIAYLSALVELKKVLASLNTSEVAYASSNPILEELTIAC